MSNDKIGIQEYWYLMNRIAYWLVANNRKFKTRAIYGYFNRVADYGTIVKAIRDRGTNYEKDALISEFVECAIVDNQDLSFMPKYVSGSDGTKYYLDTVVSMSNRVSAWEVTYGESPNFVYLKAKNTTSNNIDITLQKVYNAIGTFDSIDGFLEKIQGRKYAYYYNSRYNTDETINRLKNRSGLNCTDITQLMYRVAIALGYKDVQIVHVKCRGGDGHVRIRMRDKKSGGFFYRDGAAVLNGESITSNWCSNGTILAYNPSWIFSDIYQ